MDYHYQRISNNCGNDKNEILFWKVFSNISIFKYIFKMIHHVEWVKNYYHYHIHSQNRLKFKDIYSLKWMISKKQYQLIKYKINNNELIVDFDIDGLFSRYSKLTNKITGYKFKELKKNEKEKKVITDENRKEIQIEINEIIETLKLLLSSSNIRSNLESTYDLTFEVVKHNCLGLLKILTSEPFSIKIYPITLEIAISRFTPSIVIELLSLNKNNKYNLINDRIRDISINLAYKNNKEYQSEMIECILDNPDLYHHSQSISLQQPHDQDKFILNQMNNYEYNYKGKEFKENKITTRLFYQIKNQLESFKILKKLMELDFIIVYNKNNKNYFEDFGDWFKITHSIEELLILLKCHFKYSNPTEIKITQETVDQVIIMNNGDQEKQFKELVKLIIIEFKEHKYTICELVNGFIFKYEESIDEYHNDGFISDNLNDYQKKSLAFFRYLVGNHLAYFNDYGCGYDAKGESKKFLKQCMEYVFSGKFEYYSILCLLKNGMIQRKRTFEYGKICHLVISSYQTIDWLSKYSSSESISILKKFIEERITIEFSNIQLFNYFLQNENLKSLVKPLMLDDMTNEDIFKYALEVYGIDKIKQMFFSSESYYYYYNFSHEKCLILIEFLNKYCFNGLSSKCFYWLLSQLQGKKNQSLDSIISKIVINLNDIYQSDQYIYDDLLHSIEKDSYEITKMFINNIKIIKFTDKQLQKIRNGSIRYCEKQNLVSLVSLISLLIVKLKNNKNLVDDIDEFNSIQVLINYYFEILILSSNNIEQISGIYNQLIEIGIKINHSPYHSLYYLSIRNCKFIKFLEIRNIDIKKNKANEIGDSGQYFNHNDFTFEFILGGSYNEYYQSYQFIHSFDEILNLLVYQISIQLFSTTTNNNEMVYKNLFHKIINLDLEFFLLIRRLDLFFSHLQFIKQKLLNCPTRKLELEPSLKSINYFYSYVDVSFPKITSTFSSASSKLSSNSDLHKQLENSNTLSPLIVQFESEKWKENLTVTGLTYINSFNFSAKVIRLSVMLMDVESIQSFIEFNFHVCGFLDFIFQESLIKGRYENLVYILNNYKKIEIPFPYIFSEYPKQIVKERYGFLVNHYPDKVSSSNFYNIDNDLYCYQKEMEYPELLIGYLSNINNDYYYQQFINIESRSQMFIDEFNIFNEIYKLGINCPTSVEINQVKEKHLKSIIQQDINIQNLIKLSIYKLITQIDRNFFDDINDFIKEYLDPYPGCFILS